MPYSENIKLQNMNLKYKKYLLKRLYAMNYGIG